MFEIIDYNRGSAIAYAHKWALGRNPAYLDFQGLGGDCTNFVSQCLYAGGGVMNHTPTVGWYYQSAAKRTASWTGVEYFYRFLVQNKAEGPFAAETDLNQAELGDVIQLGDWSGHFYHTLFISGVNGKPEIETMKVCAHTDDSLDRPLNSYFISTYRLLHIQGFRKWV